MTWHFITFSLLLLNSIHRCHGQLQSLGDGSNDDAFLRQWLRTTRKLASRQLGEADVSINNDKLAVIVLLTDLDRKDRDRLQILRTSLELCERNLFQKTPSKFYVFTFMHQVGYIIEGLGDMMKPHVAVLPLLNSTWTVPHIANNHSHWHSFQTANYRIMGDWRLSFMPSFAREMGHRYLMQLDDDSYILGPVPYNLVRLFDSRGYLLGARNVHRDPLIVTWGLPELARYFIVTRKIVPATLFDFCDPPNIKGLHSEFKRARLEEGEMAKEAIDRLEKLDIPHGGWNRTILFGNCVMYSLDWYFSTEVHHFVQLCRATGGAFAYRWNEQGVLAMLWQIFVPRSKFILFSFPYQHRINYTTALELAMKYRG